LNPFFSASICLLYRGLFLDWHFQGVIDSLGCAYFLTCVILLSVSAADEGQFCAKRRRGEGEGVQQYTMVEAEFLVDANTEMGFSTQYGGGDGG
jgi:hypothetical protein